MKAKPEHYLQAAKMLHERAAMATIPHEKAQVSAIARMAEHMAKIRSAQLQKAQQKYGAAIEAAISGSSQNLPERAR